MARTSLVPSPPPPPKRLNVYLPADLVERVRNAVFWTPGATLSSLVEAALVAHLSRQERRRGNPFPPRPERGERRGKRPR